MDADIDPTVWTRRWTVHVQQIWSGEHATRYLSRYIYRVALGNHALERFAHGRVTFRYTHARSRETRRETRRETLPVDVFIGRFLQHVLPRGFPKVRSYGLLSPTSRPDLERARAVLTLHAERSRHTSAITTVTVTSPPSTSNTEGSTSGPPCSLCPVCQRGHLRLVERCRRSRAPP